jgi:hypothetical protein
MAYVRVIKIKVEETVEHTARTQSRNPYMVCEEKDHLEDLGINGSSVSKIYLINNTEAFGVDSFGMS